MGNSCRSSLANNNASATETSERIVSSCTKMKENNQRVNLQQNNLLKMYTSEIYDRENGAFKPKSLKENCIRTICLMLLSQEELPRGIPSELIERMIESFSKYHALTRTVLNCFRGCDISKISLSNCKGVNDLWLSSCNELNLENLVQLDLSNCWSLKKPEFIQKPKFLQLQRVKLRNCFNVQNITLNCIVSSPHLKELDLTNCKLIDSTGLQLLLNAKSLRCLSLEGCDSVDDRAMERLTKLQSLTSLNLSRCNSVTEKGFVELSQLQNLRKLNLGWCKNTTRGVVRSLAELKHLTELDLARCPIYDQCLSWLRQLTMLKALDLYGCSNLTDDPLYSCLADLTQLTSLNVSNCPMIHRIPPELGHRLRTLRAGNSGFDDDSFEVADNFSVLQTLDLDSCRHVGDDAMYAIATFTSLTSLAISETSVTEVGLKSLYQLKNLKELSLFACNIDEYALQEMASTENLFPNLTSLNLDVGELSDVGLSGVSSFPKLKKLDIFSATVSDEGLFNHISALPELEHFESCGGRLTDRGLEHIVAYCPNLTRLNLSQNKRIGNAGAGSLSKLSKLRFLNISYTSITPSGLGKVLPSLLFLETLSAYDCNFSQSSDQEIFRDLPSLRCIRC